MAKLVTALFTTRQSSLLAVDDIVRHGFPRDDMSLQMTDTDRGMEFFTDVNNKAPEGGVTGTIIGALIGGILAALTASGLITDPGLGLHEVGAAYGTLAGIAIGGLIGLIVGLLTGSAVPEYESNLYPMGSHTGGVMLGVYCPNAREAEVRHLMAAAGGDTIRAKNVANQMRKGAGPRDFAGVIGENGTTKNEV